MSNLTSDTIFEAMRLLDAPPRFDTILGSGSMLSKIPPPDFIGLPTHDQVRELQPKTMLGMRIIELPNMPRRPVLEISKDFQYVSPEFRKAWDAWALERFGTEEVVYMIDSGAMQRLSLGMSRDFDHLVMVALLGAT